tara:strand:+ start:23127 stop:24242 length:1116 start_codon:yes stop_codon:yes gene_type:complete
MKKALITGITGQDGSYLAEFLLKKDYEVHGMKRRSSSFNTSRIDHLFYNKDYKNKFFLHFGDLSDSSNIFHLINKIRPDEIYNLAAQSHVSVSFDIPEYTSDINALGSLRILEAIRLLGLQDKTKFYQASSSELFGLVQETPQKESTPFYPRSPYAVAKLYAFWITVNYRESYGLYACNGILFNHESPRRGETFVTRKITRGLSRIIVGLEDCLYMGNLDAKRDWGHAKDYVEMQWLMLQEEEPDDYIISTGKQFSVRDFISWSAEELGLKLKFKGEGINEVGIISKITNSDLEGRFKVGDTIIRIDEKYFRPAEVETLLGDFSKAKDKLKWSPKTSVKEMCKEMISKDFKSAKKEILLKENNYDYDKSNE